MADMAAFLLFCKKLENKLIKYLTVSSRIFRLFEKNSAKSNQSFMLLNDFKTEMIQTKQSTIKSTHSNRKIATRKNHATSRYLVLRYPPIRNFGTTILIKSRTRNNIYVWVVGLFLVHAHHVEGMTWNMLPYPSILAKIP
jgi:hypothetical protein